METKSVFLYGVEPTAIKQQWLEHTQKEYAKLINRFIEWMAYDSTYYLALLNNTCQAPVIRKLEKELRSTHELGSAYGQNAIDRAVVELHNHFDRIRNKLYGFVANKMPDLVPYVQSIAVFNAVLTGQDEIAVLQSLLNSDKKEHKANKDYYLYLIHFLEKQSQEQREENREQIHAMFEEKLNYWKLPLVKQSPIQLDTRVCKLEKADHIQADYVLSVKLIGSKDRVHFPLKTSTNSLRRMNQYKTCSPTLSFRNGKVKVAVPFEKKVKETKHKRIIGVDAGITDLLYSSDQKAYGTFTGMSEFYEKTVEVKTGHRSQLRAVMRKRQKELKSCTNEGRKQVLRKKIHNIASQLNQTKDLDKCRQKYAHEVDIRLNQAVKTFFKDIKKQPVLVAMESLEIDEFDRGKKANKRDSSWIRGKLLTKLQEILKWNGVPFVEIDPAYTSKCCPKCWNVDDNNRNGKTFRCTVCNHKADADHNASENIQFRATDEKVAKIAEQYAYSTYKRHQALRELFKKRHRRYLESIQVAI